MKHVLKNQLFLWRLCFKTCPGYMIYFLYDGFRYQGIIFLEHVLGIRYVLHCAEYQEPFWKAFLFIGIILLINLIQIIPDGYFIHGWSFRAKPKLYRALKEQMFEKASQIDLSCYDDPDYYNDFVLAVAEAEGPFPRDVQHDDARPDDHLYDRYLLPDDRRDGHPVRAGIVRAAVCVRADPE